MTSVNRANTHETEQDAEKIASAEQMNTRPVEYSAGVVRLGDIVSVPTDTEAPADISNDESTSHLEEKSFSDFGVVQPIVDALDEAGKTYPFPIQALTLPVALDRHDIIGQAKTGTGKTLGFAIPVVQHVLESGTQLSERVVHKNSPKALIVVPTRELAKQVASDLREISQPLGIKTVELYGGVAIDQQIELLKKGSDIAVGTPGRLIDLQKRGVLTLSNIHTVVLDEADEMLDLGFLPDVETLLSFTPGNRHTMLFSATMPSPVVALARRFMSQPTHIRAQDPTDQDATVKSVKQVIYRAHALNKVEVVARILQAIDRGRTVIFCRTKRTAAKLDEDLKSRGFAVGALHGDLGQGAREQAMRAFRNGKIDVLVATDVAARGIDVDDVTHVINYQCPEDSKIYLHRIGRTGRAGASGTAVTFVDWDDVHRWSLISKALGLGVREPLETYHTSEHLYTDLDIPRNVTDRLPQDRRTRAGLEAEVIENIGETRRQKGNRTPSQRNQTPPVGRSRSRRQSSQPQRANSQGVSHRSSSTKRQLRDNEGSHQAAQSQESEKRVTRTRRRTRRRNDSSSTNTES